MTKPPAPAAHRRKPRPPETYLEAAFAWRIRQLTPAQQLRYYPLLGQSRRLWWEWTEDGWREIE